ncbi:MAG: exonuclease SbcCD subunit D [Planctomycetaceae bacterium]
MPFEPLRFVHASNLCLDATLQCTIALPHDAQSAVEDATLDAFQNVIDGCIEQNVDFLLLTGNSFIERDRSLRARLALRDGFRELQKNRIAVFVTPGEHDPSEAWQAIPELPDNVTVCYPSNPESVAVMRDGKVIATIANNLFYGEADHFGIKSSPTTGDRRPYRIGMLHASRLAELELPSSDYDFDAERELEDQNEDVEGFQTDQKLASFLRQALVDYAVLAGQVTRRTIRLKSGLAHAPGRTQPLASADHGKHGATLVQVDSTGQATCARVPTVTTRWKSFDVQLEHELSPEEVLDRCREKLAADPRDESEVTWLVTWNIVAPRSVVEDFGSTGYIEAFAESIELAREADDPAYVHSFRVFPAAVVDETLGEDLLVSQFLRHASDLQIDEEMLQELISASATDLAWNDRMRAVAPELDRDLVLAHLKRFGGHWFAQVGVAEEVGVAAAEAFEEEESTEGAAE